MLKTLISATVIAATAALATVPAQAASGFSIELRSGQGAPTVHIDGRGGDWGWHRDRGRHGRDWGRRDARLSPRDIHRSLRHRGFENIDVRGARGPVYVVFATGRRGMPVKLTVNAYNGNIIDRERLGRRW
ncbi:hypothetical protein [Pannonibacter phragmitetus]|uniref:hypothetical protein n=1 Tax=Pannonibacter phragmitetus TaxID=121719 RepID=UPI003D2EDAE9